MSAGWAGPSSWKLTRFSLFCLSFLTTLTMLFNAGFFLVASKLFFNLTVKGLVALTLVTLWVLCVNSNSESYGKVLVCK